MSQEIILNRNELKVVKLDLDGKAIIIGFNEPPFKYKLKDDHIDAKLNARLVTYFLPAVEVARMQKEKPRFLIVSGINMALLWNSRDEEERKRMLANNAIKLDFLRNFFETFFESEFSLIEYVISQDVLKISEDKIAAIWKMVDKKYPEKVREVKFQLMKFANPSKFNYSRYQDLPEALKTEIDNFEDVADSFKYAVAHLFVFADLNFEGNYIHTADGYFSIGGEAEEYFNLVRNVSFEILQDYGELLLDRKVIIYDNDKLVLKNKFKIPPPYNGITDGEGFLEVSYENGRRLDFYDNYVGTKEQMDYMYANLLGKEEYEKFWTGYRDRYFKLKEKYRLAYKIGSDW
jgi:hypothetical protein